MLMWRYTVATGKIELRVQGIGVDKAKFAAKKKLLRDTSTIHEIEPPAQVNRLNRKRRGGGDCVCVCCV